MRRATATTKVPTDIIVLDRQMPAFFGRTRYLVKYLLLTDKPDTAKNTSRLEWLVQWDPVKMSSRHKHLLKIYILIN
jgi:hypothetical protein